MEDLTLKELESLANDYFDCKLSRQEETALREVLLMSPLRSETRAVWKWGWRPS